MFSDAGFAQEVAALVVVAGAAVFLAGRLFGWPRVARRRRDDGPPVVASRRLARALAKAEQRQ